MLDRVKKNLRDWHVQLLFQVFLLPELPDQQRAQARLSQTLLYFFGEFEMDRFWNPVLISRCMVGSSAEERQAELNQSMIIWHICATMERPASFESNVMTNLRGQQDSCCSRDLAEA